jgi:hypothetical protein
MNDNPIFIAGLDRSGKTLLRLALSAHPNLALTRRTYMWPRFYQRYGDLAQRRNFERCLSSMLEQKTIQQFNPDTERIRREFSCGEPSYAHLFALFHRQFAEKLGKKRWGEQAGLIERFAPAIIQAFPAAKIIHLVRDPRNRCEEILNTTPPAFRPGKIGALTAGWLFSARLAHRHQSMYPQHYKVLNYESLLSQPQQTLEELCEFVAEDFTPEMLTLETSISFGKPVQKTMDFASIWQQDTIHFKQAEQKSLTPAEVIFIQKQAHQEMAWMGYPSHPIELPRIKSLQLFLEWPLSLIRMATWRLFETRQVS